MSSGLKFWKKNKQEGGRPLDESTSAIMPALTPTLGYASHPLAKQIVIPASAETKIRVAIIATALVDALGGPPEFKPRFSFPFTETFKQNLNFRDKNGNPLEPGVWTDDTSMTLCLARSIARDGFNEQRQLDAYLKWLEQGELSAIGYCFDIGNTTRVALSIHQADPDTSLARIATDLSDKYSAGNGSLMRLIPVPLAFWRDPKAASDYARRSSKTTHPTALCQEICAFWTDAVVQIMNNACNSQGGYSKLQFLQYISEYPFEDEQLKAALTIPAADATQTVSSSAAPSGEGMSEEEYWKNHPLLRLIATTRDSDTAKSTGYLKLPTSKELPSSGFVLHSTIAALYCFFSTDNFEAGAVMAVNLGSDADTTGAIYAGLAACWYGEALPKKYEDDLLEDTIVGCGLFWSHLVRGWRKALVKRDVVEKVAEELVKFEKDWVPGNL